VALAFETACLEIQEKMKVGEESVEEEMKKTK